MSNSIKCLSGLILLISSWSAFATEQISKRMINEIAIYDSYAVIHLATPALNLDGCTRQNAGAYIKIVFDSENNKEMYSTVLAARIAKQSVGFGVSGCSSWGGVTIPLAYRVDF